MGERRPELSRRKLVDDGGRHDDPWPEQPDTEAEKGIRRHDLIPSHPARHKRLLIGAFRFPKSVQGTIEAHDTQELANELPRGEHQGGKDHSAKEQCGEPGSPPDERHRVEAPGAAATFIGKNEK